VAADACEDINERHFVVHLALAQLNPEILAWAARPPAADMQAALQGAILKARQDEIAPRSGLNN
jgi:hypothetical protein